MKTLKAILWAGCLIFIAISGYSQVGDMPLNKIKDRDTFINSLMDEMTLEEKIGQLNLLTAKMAQTGPAIKEGYIKDIKAGRCGGIFNAYTPDFVRKLQEYAVNKSRLHIPLIFGLDVIHGHKTIFPVPIALSCSWDTVAIEKMARMSADEATADGINWVFSPMVDITRDPRWGRVVEGAGEDPWLGSKIAKAYVRGYQGKNLMADSTVLACVKHFALYGAVEGGRDYNVVSMNRQKMFNFYLPPYKAAIDAGVGSVMLAFNSVNGIPVTANHWLGTNILRKKWNFKGLVVTDYGAIHNLTTHGIVESNARAAALTLQAGAGMDMMSTYYIRYLKKLLKKGKMGISEIDKAVRNVLEAKYELGLFEDPYRYINNERAKTKIMSKDKLDFAQKIAEKSIVLLKNEKKILPLNKSGTIAVIGPLAKDHRDMDGPWAIAGNWHQTTTILEGIRKVVSNKATVLYCKGANITDNETVIKELNKYGGKIKVSDKNTKQLMKEAVSIAKKSDVVIMCLGESQGMSGEGASRADIRIPKSQRKLLKSVYATGKPIVLILSNGRPLVLTWENSHIPAILESWFLGTKSGDAIANVLFGEYNPSGKLTMSFPYAIGQIPVYYNHKNTGRPGELYHKYTSKYLDIPNEPLYPFGYGLSYTHFTYSDLMLNKEIMNPNDTLHVSVTVANSGSYDGEETVQLYIRDLVGSITRPVKELRGLKKIFLKEGQSRNLEFNLTAQDLKFFDANLKYDYELGKFKVFVGGNSKEVLGKEFELRRK